MTITFGGEHIDVTSPPAPLAAAWSDGVTSCTEALAAMVAALASAGGGELYFPPGTYLIDVPPAAAPLVLSLPSPTIGRSEVSPVRALRISRLVTVRFAPGAIWELGDHANVEIEGPIFAGSYQIFTPPVPARPARGRVLLTGTAIFEVFPEWWGARSVPDVVGALVIEADSYFALQAAIDAAHSHRSLPRFADAVDLSRRRSYTLRRLPPIPVLLAGSYRVSRTLHIGPRRGGFHSEANAGAVIRGALGRLTDATASAPASSLAPAVPARTDGRRPAIVNLRPLASHPGDVLVAITDAPSTILDGVSLDGASLVDTVLAIGGEDNVQNVQLLSCSFQGARERLLQVGTPVPTEIVNRLFQRDSAGQPSGQGPGGKRVSGIVPEALPKAIPETSGLRVDRCVFVATFDYRTEVPLRTYAVELFAPTQTAHLFTGCRFTGRASAMILAYSGVFWLSGCVFNNEYLPDPTIPVGTFPNGADVFLARPPGDRTTGMRPAAFSATNCDSRSTQFLATFYGSGRSDFDQVTVLLNVRQGDFNRPASVPEAPVSTAPAVYWGGIGTLVLVGSSFRSVKVESHSLLANAGSVLTRLESVAPHLIYGNPEPERPVTEPATTREEDWLAILGNG